MRRRKQTTMTDVTLLQAYFYFKEEKIANNLSEQTLQTYDLHIMHFLNSMDLISNDIITNFICIDIWNMWIDYMKNDEEKKDVTITSYARSVRAFLYWCMDNDFLEYFDIKLPKYQHTKKICYTDEELTLLLEKPEKGCSEVTYLSWVFINLSISTGLRLSSMLNIKISDYNKKEKTINITHTKNRESKIVLLNDNMSAILNKYISLFELSGDDYLFCTAEGSKLAKRSIQDYIYKYNKNKGVEKTSIHLFRHTFAKNYYLKTKDIYGLCNILGHTTVSTTENYLKDLDITDFNSVAFNPQLEFTQSKKKRRGKLSL